MFNNQVIQPFLFRIIRYVCVIVSDVICTYLYKIKARQERDAVLGGLLLGFALGGHHLGVGPVTACRQNNK